MHIGTNIKKYRNEAGITMMKLSQSVGISQGALSFYESGKRTPNDDLVKLIAAELNIDVEKLYEGCSRASQEKSHLNQDEIKRTIDILGYNTNIVITVDDEGSSNQLSKFMGESILEVLVEQEKLILVKFADKLKRYEQEILEKQSQIKVQLRQIDDDLKDTKKNLMDEFGKTEKEAEEWIKKMEL